MISKHLFGCLSLVLLLSWPLLTPGQKREEGDRTRESFLDTRPKQAVAHGGKSAKSPPTKRPPSVGPIGIGYTLYKQSPEGNPVRVSSSQEFRQEDRLRLMIEPNITGHLYVFNSENDGLPEMIFPNPRLNGGDNRIEAHVPIEVPSREEANPVNRWFEVQGEPATEHLYLIITRTPLEGVPTGVKLLAHCRGKSGECAWQPAATAWSQLAAKVDAAVPANQEAGFGQKLATVERQAVERKIALPPSAPAPSVIKMNQSPQAKMLVTVIDLIHK